MTVPRLIRDPHNPVLEPSHVWWEREFVFNPAAVEVDEVIHLLYRAHGIDRLSRLGHAWSRDGVHFERDSSPAIEGDVNDPMDRLGVEDARAVVLDGWVYATFTSASVEPVIGRPDAGTLDDAPWRTRVSMARTRDFRSWERFGVVIPEYNSKNAVLFPEKIGGRYAMLHRVAPDIWLAFSDDLRHWDNHRCIMRVRNGHWDHKRIGSGPPPIRVEKGWLLFYHGISPEHTYRLGAALLDADDPSNVLVRLNDWLIEPEEEFEKQGWISNVVFPTGCIERDGVFRLYYGGADKVICAATIPRFEIESALYRELP